jgi:WD40 repeat protein
VRARDALLVAAIMLVIGFAARDALRGGDESDPPPPRAPEEPVSGNPERLRIDGAGDLAGRLVFTDERCRVIELELTGTVLTRMPRVGSCGLSAPPVSDRIAYSVGRIDDDGVWFRVLDLSERRESRAYLATEAPIWSPDGQRLAWCSPGQQGFELVVGGRFRALDDCADAYTPSGEPAFISGRRVIAGGDVVFAHRRRLSHVSFGRDGSIAVSVGKDVELYRRAQDRYPLYTVSDLRFRGRPILGPGNCGALLRSPQTGSPPEVTVLAFGCIRIRGSRVVPGNEAAWSPDGKWIAVTLANEILLYDVTDQARDPIHLPLEANQIVWLS